MIPLQRTYRDYAIGDLDRGGAAYNNKKYDREHLRLRRLQAHTPMLEDPHVAYAPRVKKTNTQEKGNGRAKILQMSWRQLCATTGTNYSNFRHLVGHLGIHPRDAIIAKNTRGLTQEMWDRRWTYAGK